MEEGALIDYRILLRGLPMRWRTRICRWNPPFEFIDEQLKGPYRRWIHHHTFEETDSKMTCMRDRVRYALPFAPFGDMALPFIRAELRGIFDFRRRVILEIFSHDLMDVALPRLVEVVEPSSDSFEEVFARNALQRSR